MSKVTSELQQAEEARRAKVDALAKGTGFHGLVHALKQELRQELGFSQDGPSSRLRAEAAPSIAESPAPVMVMPVPREAAASAPVHGSPAPGPSPETWDQAIAVVTRKLGEAQFEAARYALDQVRLKAELDMREELTTRVEQDRARLRQQLEESTKAASSVDAARAMWLRQLEALRECQVLSHDARMTQQELNANTAVITHLSQSQQQAAKDLAHYRQRGHTLEERLNQLQVRLSQALAVTGTTDPNVTTTPQR